MGDELFCSRGRLCDFLEGRQRELLSKVESLDPDQLLNASEHDLCEALAESYTLEAPVLQHNDMAALYPEEINIEVGPRSTRALGGRGRPVHRKGVRVTIAVPFSGNPELFHYLPLHYSGVQPRGTVVGSEVRLTFEPASPDPTVLPAKGTALRAEADEMVRQIQKYLEWVRTDIDAFNKSVREIAEGEVRQRKRRLLAQRGLVEALKIPIRRRDDAPQTYALPVRRRAPTIERVLGANEPFAAEWALKMQEYEQILDIVQNMALVMERSPSAFSRMKEEHLRDHFLVQLNGQYEGKAAGEVFNCEGRTDILIRHEEKNAFIAECKFWRGPEFLKKTVDQLLSYTTWRDTKTAIILFNRNADFTSVLKQIPDVIHGHDSFKRDADVSGESRFRFVLARPNDKSRELTLTVAAFDVPRPPSAA